MVGERRTEPVETVERSEPVGETARMSALTKVSTRVVRRHKIHQPLLLVFSSPLSPGGVWWQSRWRSPAMLVSIPILPPRPNTHESMPSPTILQRITPYNLPKRSLARSSRNLEQITTSVEANCPHGPAGTVER